MKELRSGIKLLSEIEGYGNPIKNKGRYDAVLKFYRNRGDPLEFNTILQDPIPFIQSENDKFSICWHAPKMHSSNVVFERGALLAREADVLPGIYYAILGMRKMGYRHVAIPPHLFARSIMPQNGLKENSIVKLEIFLTDIRNEGV